LEVFEDDRDENQVGIGELLSQGSVYYEYDMGDGWVHRIDLIGEAPEPLQEGELARLIEGSSRCPLEDVGGPAGWFEFKRDQLSANLWRYQQWIEFLPLAWRDLDPTVFDIDMARRQLVLLGRAGTIKFGDGTLIHTVLDEISSLSQVVLLSYGGMDAPPSDVSSDERRAFLSPFRWLIRRVGGGLPLTKAGWLPPAVVLEAVEALGWADQVYGKGNREEHLPRLAVLRSEMTRLGLLRKNHGLLVATEAARRTVDDDNALWCLIVSRLATRWRGDAERLAGGTLLLMVTSDQPLDHSRIEAIVLLSLLMRGIERSDNKPLTKRDAWWLMGDLWRLFLAVDGLVESRRVIPSTEHSTSALRTFARDVLLYAE